MITLTVCGVLWLYILAVAQDPEARLAEAHRLNLQVLQLNQAGRYADAIPLAEQVLAIYEKELPAGHPNVQTVRNTLARLYEKQGDHGRAEPLLLRGLAIEIEAKTREGKYLLIMRWLIPLAQLYEAKGDYGQAELLYGRALEIAKVLPLEHPDITPLLNNLAGLYEKQGNHGRALKFYQDALAIMERVLPPEHPDLATTLNNLALLYEHQGDFKQAEPLFQRALEIREKVLPPEHPYVATSLNNLAGLYKDQGKYRRAEPLYRRALEIKEKTLGKEHSDTATTLDNLAELYQAKGDYEQAISLFQRSLEVREKNIAAILDTGSQQQKQLYLDFLSGETDAILSLHTQDAPQNADAARLAVSTILRRKGRTLDAFTNQLAALRQRATPDDKKLLDDFAATQSQLANLLLGGGKPAPTEVTRLTAAQEQIEDVISRRSAEFRAVTQPVTLERVQAAVPADAGLVELFVYKPFNAKAKGAEKPFGAARYVAYVVRRTDAVPQFADLGEAAPIDEAANKFRKALQSPKTPETNVKELARNLDERVMRPVRQLLGQTRRVFLSPDGALNLIPFDALVDENGQYLIENYSFNYLTSGRDLLRLQVPIESRNTPAVLANPLYDMAAADQPAANEENRRSMDFKALNYPPLPGTAEEATALGRLWPEMQVLTQEQATENALKQLQSPRILHIATHGFFEPDQPREVPPAGPTLGRATIDTLSLPAVSPPSAGASVSRRWENPLLRSGLVFAGVKQQHSGAAEDGILTALETAGLDLWGTKLVVLSACETGLGDVQNGQGVYGLRRALVLAGSQTQVMSLWKVSDEGTRDLMTAYYTRLKAGEGRTEALRQVQLAMLRGELRPTQDATDYRHPYYWAAFIGSGDWRYMDGKEDGVVATRSSLRLAAILLPVVGGLVLFLFLNRRLRSRSLKGAT